MVLHRVHHDGHIQIISREMAQNAIKDVRLNPSTSYMTEIETAISAMALAQFTCQAMPLQGLFGVKILPAFVHVVPSRKRPFLELLLQLLELPGIQVGRSIGVRMCFRIHDSMV